MGYFLNILVLEHSFPSLYILVIVTLVVVISLSFHCYSQAYFRQVLLCQQTCFPDFGKLSFLCIYLFLFACLLLGLFWDLLVFRCKMDIMKSRLQGLCAFLEKITAIGRKRLVSFVRPRVFCIFPSYIFSIGALGGLLRHFGLQPLWWHDGKDLSQVQGLLCKLGQAVWSHLGFRSAQAACYTTEALPNGRWAG